MSWHASNWHFALGFACFAPFAQSTDAGALQARVSPMKEAEYQVGFLKYVNEFNKKYDTAEVFHK